MLTPSAAGAGDLAAQAAQVSGALLVLAAFVAVQLGWVATRGMAYLALNLVGSAVLAVVAASSRQYGFLLLELSWAVVTAWSLVRVLRAR